MYILIFLGFTEFIYYKAAFYQNAYNYLCQNI